jgi:F-type H+-transporting ATPase subunit b
MDFLKDLGFDPIMLGAQILNFLIIFYLLKRFLYKPVFDMIKKREEKINDGLKQAEDARITLENALEQESKILTKAQDQAKNILSDAKTQAAATASEIEERAKVSAERMIADAKQQMNDEATEIEKRISERTAIVAMDMLTKSLKGLFSEREQKEVISKALKSIKGSN